MTSPDLMAPRRRRPGVALVVIALHVVAVGGLVRAFAPDFTARVAQQVVTAFTVTVTTPPPEPPASAAPRRESAAAPVGVRAKPDEVAAPRPRLAIATERAPVPAGHGEGSAMGAGDRGAGAGAGGQGDGSGGGGGRAVEKIAGDISSARDFPRKTRALRNGHEVVVRMAVGTDGRASGCRVVRPGPDAEADAIVCRLAEQRFRFRPRLDAAGNPVAASYQWRQRWWDPRIDAETGH